MLVCFLVCFYVTLFAWLLLTFSQICVLHLHGGPFGVPLKKNLWQYGVLFCVLIRQIFLWLLFSLFSDVEVPLHSLWTKSNLIQRIYKCIDVFSLWHSSVLANVGKYWSLYVCVLDLHFRPFGVPFFINIFDMLVCFLVCFYVKMASFNFLIQRIDKCLYVFSLWHRGVNKNVGKYWQFYVCVLHLHCGPFGVPFY